MTEQENHRPLEERISELEKDVLKEKKFLEDFIEAANILIVGFNREGNITIFNKKAEEVVGYAKSEIINQPITKILSPDSRFDPAKYIREYEKDAEQKLECETTIVTKTGEPRVIAWKKTLLKGEQGETIGIVAFGDDITEKRRTEQQIYNAQRMESMARFAVGVAHDLNNILGGVIGHASFAKTMVNENDQIYKNINIIESSASRGSELTKQLLDFGRGGKPKMKRLSINDTVKETMDVLQRSLDKNITIEIELDPNVGLVEADPAQMQQILLNICLNSRDAMPEGGKLSIKCVRVSLGEEFCRRRFGIQPGDYAHISIADTGTGIDTKIIYTIFEPFFTTKEKKKNPGLGLSIAYGIIKRHNGYIFVDSQPGKGTTFNIYLPLLKQAESAEIEEKDQPLKGNETILVVDDEKLIVDTVSEMLKKLGYLVLTASDGDEAVKIYEEHKNNVDLIILDMIMPKLGGKDTYRELKGIKRDVKVLLTSGYIDQKTAAQEMFKEGALGFIPKPYKVETLSKVIRDAIEKSA